MLMKGDWPTILAIIFCQSGLRIEDLSDLSNPSPHPPPSMLRSKEPGQRWSPTLRGGWSGYFFECKCTHLHSLAPILRYPHAIQRDRKLVLYQRKLRWWVHCARGPSAKLRWAPSSATSVLPAGRDALHKINQKQQLYSKKTSKTAGLIFFRPLASKSLSPDFSTLLGE